MEDSALIIHVDINLAQGIHAGAVGFNCVAREFAANACQSSNAVVDGINRAVADTRFRAGALADLKSHACRRNGTVGAAAHDVNGVEFEEIFLSFVLFLEKEQRL